MIKIKNLHKSYQMGKNSLHVLKGIDFEVKEGELVAIMGSSGSGKSTLIKLLLRLYDVDSGHILFDDIDIKDLEIHTLRKNIGLVSQDIFLFEVTVFENIAYGNLEASEKEI